MTSPDSNSPFLTLYKWTSGDETKHLRHPDSVYFSNLTRRKKSTTRSCSQGNVKSTLSAAEEDANTATGKPPHDTKMRNSKDLPPSRKSTAIKPVSPPLSKISLHKFIYALTFILLLFGAFYSYRMVQYKTQIGGWWNLLMGKSPVYNQGHGPGGEHYKSCSPSESTVEDRINAIAEALGMPSSDLAQVIAAAVVQHRATSATLSSVTAKKTGEAINVLPNEEKQGGGLWSR